MKYIFILLLGLLLFSCGEHPMANSKINAKKAALELFGNTQGTTYSIICNEDIPLQHKEIDSILALFDDELSTYKDSSFISQFNQLNTGSIQYSSKNLYFQNCLYLSDSVFKLSDGLFDPSVLPLVDAWSFFKTDRDRVPDSLEVDSLRSLVSFSNGRHFNYSHKEIVKLTKITPGFRLDFNAIAQGYSVDVIYDFLKKKGANNFYIEIGGEVRVSGLRNDETPWVIGIDKPMEGSEERVLISKVSITDKSIATSGSYRKFYEKNGTKYSHTINPKTGYPVQHTLLSATVVSETCALADAFATQFMVMGVEKSMEFVKAHPELELAVYFIFNNSKGRLEVAFNQSFDKLLLKE